MSIEAQNYAIYDLKTGHLAARIGRNGVVLSTGNEEAVATLNALMQRDIVIREHQINYDPEVADEEYDAYPEENMCYFGVVTLRPDDPRYLAAFLQRLPYISFYEARPGDSEEE